MQEILFFDYDRTPNLKNKRKLRSYLSKLFLKEKINIISVYYIFCSDNHIIRINNDFLKHNYYTDVISFNLADSEDEIQGEIYISVDRVRDNSMKEGVSYKEELHRVIFHGSLHLCGYDDRKEEDITKMRTVENRHIKKYFKE
jgi:rRNA maturation RNase YbeY